MGKLAKNKGKRGEREVSKLLSVLTGNEIFVDVQANGADIISIPGLSIEVKRQEKLNISVWWKQTCRQAAEIDNLPILFYRQNRRRWQVCLPAYLFVFECREGYIDISLQVFTVWLRKYLGASPFAAADCQED